MDTIVIVNPILIVCAIILGGLACVFFEIWLRYTRKKVQEKLKEKQAAKTETKA
ncbi:MAG: hypothetical protein QXF44_02485 [Candidatus Bathyarchaeia archaeon]